MMVNELVPHILNGHKWIYHDIPVMATSEEEAERYDATLEPMEKNLCWQSVSEYVKIVGLLYLPISIKSEFNGFLMQKLVDGSTNFCYYLFILRKPR